MWPFKPCLIAPWTHRSHVHNAVDKSWISKEQVNQIPRDQSGSQGGSEAAFPWSCFTGKLIMISPKLNDQFHQAPSLLWLLNLCSTLKGWLANTWELVPSPRLILCGLAIYLGVQATDKPKERGSFKHVASFWYSLSCFYSTAPGTQKPQGWGGEKRILIPVEFYALRFLRIFFLPSSPTILWNAISFYLWIFVCLLCLYYWLRWEKGFHVHLRF